MPIVPCPAARLISAAFLPPPFLLDCQLVPATRAGRKAHTAGVPTKPTGLASSHCPPCASDSALDETPAELQDLQPGAHPLCVHFLTHGPNRQMIVLPSPCFTRPPSSQGKRRRVIPGCQFPRKRSTNRFFRRLMSEM